MKKLFLFGAISLLLIAILLSGCENTTGKAYTTANKINTKCTAGWKCKDSMDKAYQSTNCQWSSITYCPYSCSNGVCNSAPINQTGNSTNSTY